MNDTFSTLMTRVFEQNGLGDHINPTVLEQFEALTHRMVETNRVMNVTAITDVEKIIPLHYADCVAAAAYIPRGANLLDIGCGGGFPTLPLAIVRPDLRITGLDSTEKKVRYVQSTADELGVKICTIAARAEDVAKDPAHRERYDVVISRAVARLNILSELCLPFVAVDGQFVAMKGAFGQDEAAEAAPGIQKLGGSAPAVQEFNLFVGESAEDHAPAFEKRTIILTQKVAATPSAYPRAFGAIKKRPL